MKIIYLILLVASGFFYLLYSDNLSYFLLTALLILPAALLAAVIAGSFYIKVKVRCESETAERGRAVKIRIRIVNRSFLPVSSCNLTMKYRVCGINGVKKYQKHKAGIPIPARSVESIIINVKAEHCGAVECLISKVSFTDLIGLFSVPKKLGFHEVIPIIPLVYPFDTTVVSSMNTDLESDIYSQTRPGSDPSEVFALREYRDGDLQNRIHWKLSSRSDEVIVKELSEPVSSRVLLIPDFSACRTDEQADGVLDVFASLSYFLAKKRLPHSAVLSAQELTSARIANVEELYSFLAEQVKGLESTVKDPAAIIEYFAAEANVHSIYSHVIIISAAAAPAVLREIEMLVHAERISMICLDRESAENQDDFFVSETVEYYTAVDSFYEDLALFAI